ncbi:MAG: hypothetical protein F9K43_28365, partial [Bauldia sp.]
MSETGWPERFWGPETLDPAAWAELTPLLDTREEIEAEVRRCLRTVGRRSRFVLSTSPSILTRSSGGQVPGPVSKKPPLMTAMAPTAGPTAL